MFDSDFDRGNRSLLGICVSAVSLLVLACLAGFSLMFLGIAYVRALIGDDLYSIGQGVGAGFITFGGCALSIITFWAWKALYRERAWVLWIARTWAVLLLVLGWSDLYRLHRPHAPTADEYFGIVYDPVLIIGGAVWLLYLWLPKVRARFGAHPSGS